MFVCELFKEYNLSSIVVLYLYESSPSLTHHKITHTHTNKHARIITYLQCLILIIIILNNKNNNCKMLVIRQNSGK